MADWVNVLTNIWWKQSEGVILFGTLTTIGIILYNQRKERTMAYKKKNGKGGKKK